MHPSTHDPDPTDSRPLPFDVLTPDFILNAVEASGLCCDGRVFALNSYENRVFQIGIDGDEPVIAKFYRPRRWSVAQILEEHDFVAELAANDIPVVAAIPDENGRPLRHHAGFDFALFPRKGGRAPESELEDVRFMLGRLIGRLHATARVNSFHHRPLLTVRHTVAESADYLLSNHVPAELRNAYETLIADLLAALDPDIDRRVERVAIRVHGDLHPGNILWREELMHLVDFDDSLLGPAIQDFWMMLSGDHQSQTRQMMDLVEGYEEFDTFDMSQLEWLEPLRLRRMVQYSAWLARRAHEPAFQLAFPWSGSVRYWSSQILDLREQLHRLREPALTLRP